MSKKDESSTEETTLEFPVMPGADAPEDDDAPQLDLSFEEVLEEISEVADDEEAPPEEAKEAEEATDDGEKATDDEEAEEAAEEDVDDDESPLKEAAELEEPEVEEKPAKKTMVPKARLDEVLAKQKALQKQLDEIKVANEKAEDAPEDYDFDQKEVEYQNMVLDGETDKAVALRREIRKAEREQLEFEMRQEMTQTVTKDRQMNALQQAANVMEETYPVFNSNAEEFNEDYTNEVVELRDAFIVQGFEAVDALSKAVKFVVKDHDLDQVQESAPSLAGKAQKSVDEVAKKRAQVKKKLQAADAQPPELPGESSSTHGEKALDLSTMTEEEFAALPEATIKRLRGDIL
jgi:hypothetical protein